MRDLKGMRFYLAQKAGEWKTPIAGERPYHSRRRRYRSNGTAKRQCNDYSNHGRSACDRAGRLEEYLHVRVPCGRFQYGVNIPQTKERGQQNGKSKATIYGNARDDGTRDRERWILDFFGHLESMSMKDETI